MHCVAKHQSVVEVGGQAFELVGNESVPDTGEALHYLGARYEDMWLYDDHIGLVRTVIVVVVIQSQTIAVEISEIAYHSD